MQGSGLHSVPEEQCLIATNICHDPNVLYYATGYLRKIILTLLSVVLFSVIIRETLLLVCRRMPPLLVRFDVFRIVRELSCIA
jgi:hypothetical protein